MKTIYKYKLNPGYTELELPLNAEVLHADCVGNDVFIWCLVHPEEDYAKEKRVFQVFGTGFNIPEDKRFEYVSTCKMYDGALIWHVFEVIK